jgi:hypothetical protein
MPSTVLNKITKKSFSGAVSPANGPVTIALRSLRCIIETDEVGSDEPYVLVTAADLSGIVPNVEVVKYGAYGDVDKGETVVTQPIPPNMDSAVVASLASILNLRVPFWPLAGLAGKTITDASKVIFVVSLVENDDGDTSAMRTLVKSASIASLAASTSMARSDRVSKLIADIKGALQIPTGAPNFDDPVGTQELKVSAANLITARSEGSLRKSLTFTGDGGKYSLVFEILRK